MGEAQTTYIREFKVGTFRGEFPTIVTDTRVNVDALVDGDEKPFYITLPVAKIGEISRNKLFYDKGLVDSIKEQMIGKGGLLGHIADDERDTEYPIEDIDWVGAAYEDDTLWGKAYVPPGEARDFIRRIIARNGEIATSIYGTHQGKEPGENGSHRLRGFRLETLDLAPPNRAALFLGGKFAVTAQMTDESDSEDEMPTREEVIASLAAGELPEAIKAQVISEYQSSQDDENLVAELRQDIDDRDKVISELNSRLTDYQNEAFDNQLDGLVSETLDWNVQGDEAKEKLASLRRMLRGRIVAELGEQRDEESVKAAFDAAWAEMEPIAEMMRDSLSGPKVRGNGKLGGTERDKRNLDTSPEALSAERAKWQF